MIAVALVLSALLLGASLSMTQNGYPIVGGMFGMGACTAAFLAGVLLTPANQSDRGE